jgi:hypothetical protein
MSIVISSILMVQVEVVKFFIYKRFVSCKGQNDRAGDHYMHYRNAYHFYCFHPVESGGF